MKKELSIGKILIAVLLMLTASLCAYMGVMAIKKSMYLNLSFNASPSVKCEIYMKTNSQDSFSKIFSNIRGSEMIAPDMFLNERTSTLSFSNSFNGGLGTGFFLKVYNHENKKLFVETAGAGTSYTSIVIGAYNGETALNETLIVSSVTGDAQIKFTQVEEVIPTLTATQFDLTATGNTLIKKNNHYYTPLGTDAVFKLIKTAGADDEVSVTSLKINETAKNYGAWYNKTTDIMTIPSANVNGTIEFDSLASWDGDIAPSFSGGDGTPASPYQIANGEELALLAEIVYILDDVDGSGIVNASDVYTTANGTEYHVATCRTANYEMTNNLYLNDEQYSYNTNTGIVTISDGVKSTYLGTNIDSSTILGRYYTFNGTAYSIMPTQPTATSGTITNVPKIIYGSDSSSQIHIFNPIKDFRGQFNGQNYSIIGAYNSIFATIRIATIKDLNIFNCLSVSFSSQQGGLINISYAGDIINCRSLNCIVLGNDRDTGMLVGRVYSSYGPTNIKNCSVTNGFISGRMYSGGLVGQTNITTTLVNSYVIDTKVFGTFSCGGLCGLTEDGLTYNCYVKGCDVIGDSNTSNKLIGRILLDDDIASNCYADGTLIGRIEAAGELRYSGIFTSPTSVLTTSSQNTAGYTTLISTTNLPTALNAWLDAIYSGTTTNRVQYGLGSVSWATNANINGGYPYLNFA